MSTRQAMSGIPNTRHMLISPNPSLSLLLVALLDAFFGEGSEC